MGNKRHNLLSESGVKVRKRPMACRHCREVKLKCILLEGKTCERCVQKGYTCYGPEHTLQRLMKKHLKQGLKPQGRRREHLEQDGMLGSSQEGKQDFSILTQNELQHAVAPTLPRVQEPRWSESHRKHSLDSLMYHRPQNSMPENSDSILANGAYNGRDGAYIMNSNQPEYNKAEDNRQVYHQHSVVPYLEPARVWQDENRYNYSDDRSSHHPSDGDFYGHPAFHSTQTYQNPSAYYPI